MAIKRQDSAYKYHKLGDHQIVFEISDEDLAGDPQYFGYLSEDGSWLIQERTIATGNYRYIIGRTPVYKTAVTGAWATRAVLVYVYFNELT